MKKVHITIIYFTPENDGNVNLLKFTKTIEIELPVFMCGVFIKNDAIEQLDLKDGYVNFDPYIREYFVTNRCCDGLPRYGYYFGRDGYDDPRIIDIINKFETHGWKTERLKKG
jgi:hypothetical protein